MLRLLSLFGAVIILLAPAKANEKINSWRKACSETEANQELCDESIAITSLTRELWIYCMLLRTDRISQQTFDMFEDMFSRQEAYEELIEAAYFMVQEADPQCVYNFPF